MRLLRFLLPFHGLKVAIFATAVAFTASAHAADECGDRLSHPPASLNAVLKFAYEAKVLSPEAAEAFVRSMEWSNPFVTVASVTGPMYARAFAGIEAEMNDTERAAAKREFEKYLKQQGAAASGLENAREQTSEVLAPQLFIRSFGGNGLSKGTGVAFGEYSGRPVALVGYHAQGYYRGQFEVLMVDPFNSDKEKTLRHLSVWKTPPEGAGFCVFFKTARGQYAAFPEWKTIIDLDSGKRFPVNRAPIVVKSAFDKALSETREFPFLGVKMSARMVRWGRLMRVWSADDSELISATIWPDVFNEPLSVSYIDEMPYLHYRSTLRFASDSGIRHRFYYQNALTGEMRNFDFAHESSNMDFFQFHGKAKVISAESDGVRIYDMESGLAQKIQGDFAAVRQIHSFTFEGDQFAWLWFGETRAPEIYRLNTRVNRGPSSIGDGDGCEKRLEGSVHAMLTILKKSLEAKAITPEALARYAAGAATPFGESQSLTAPMRERAFKTLDASLSSEQREQVRQGVRLLLKDVEVQFAVAAEAKEATTEILRPRQEFVEQDGRTATAKAMLPISFEGRPAFLAQRRDDNSKIFTIRFDPLNPDLAAREVHLNAEQTLDATKDWQTEIGEARQFFPALDPKSEALRREPFRVNGLKVYTAATKEGLKFAAEGRTFRTFKLSGATNYVVAPVVYAYNGKLYGAGTIIKSDRKQYVLIGDIEAESPLLEVEVSPMIAAQHAITIAGVPHLFSTSTEFESELELINALTGDVAKIPLGKERTRSFTSFIYRGVSYYAWVTTGELKIMDLESRTVVSTPGTFGEVRAIYPFEYQGVSYLMFDEGPDGRARTFRLFSDPDEKT